MNYAQRVIWITSALVLASPVRAEDAKSTALSLLPTTDATLKIGTEDKTVSAAYSHLFERTSLDLNLSVPFNKDTGIAVLSKDSQFSSGIGIGLAFFFDTRFISDAERVSLIFDQKISGRTLIAASNIIDPNSNKANLSKIADMAKLDTRVGMDYKSVVAELEKWCNKEEKRSGKGPPSRSDYIKKDIPDFDAILIDKYPPGNKKDSPTPREQVRKLQREELLLRNGKPKYASYGTKPKKGSGLKLWPKGAQGQRLLAISYTVEIVDMVEAEEKEDDTNLMKLETAKNEADKADAAAAAAELELQAAMYQNEPKDMDAIAELRERVSLASSIAREKRMAVQNARDNYNFSSTSRLAHVIRTAKLSSIRSRLNAALKPSVSCSEIAKDLGDVIYAAWYAKRTSELEGLPLTPNNNSNKISKKSRVGIESSFKYNRTKAYEDDGLLVDVVDEAGNPIEITLPDGSIYVQQEKGKAEDFNEYAFEVGASAQLFLGNHIALTLRGGYEGKQALDTKKVERCLISTVDDPNYSTRECSEEDVLEESPEFESSGYVRGAVTGLFTRPTIPTKAGGETLAYAPGGEIRAQFEQLGATPRFEASGILFAAPGKTFMRGRVGVGVTVRVPFEENGDAEILTFIYLGAAL